MARPIPFAIKKQTGFTTIAILCFVMLYAPVMTLIFYSFNAGSSVALWEGFSMRWYHAAWANEQLKEVSSGRDEIGVEPASPFSI